jgi:hypothetical protein
MHQPVVSVLLLEQKAASIARQFKVVDVIFTSDELKKLDEISKLAPQYPGNVIEIMTSVEVLDLIFLKGEI